MGTGSGFCIIRDLTWQRACKQFVDARQRR